MEKRIFKAPTAKEAMSRISRDLGPDAIIVSHRKAKDRHGRDIVEVWARRNEKISESQLRISAISRLLKTKVFTASVIGGIAAVAVLLVLASLIFWRGEGVENKPAAELHSMSKVILPVKKHIAVLPFTIYSKDPESKAFCDGTMEFITSKITALGQFEDSLYVVPTREIIEKEITSPSKARKIFSVTLVITCSYQEVQDELRITLNLVDAVSLRQLDSRVLKVENEKVSRLQDEMAINTAEMLGIDLKPEEREKLVAGNTSDPDAYIYYVQGRGFLQQYQVPGNTDRAIEQFNKALQEDSSYALAYAGLGEAYLKKYIIEKDTGFADQAIFNCRRATEINEQLVPVKISLGLVYCETGHYEEAVLEFQKALKVEPRSAEAYHGLADSYSKLNKLKEAESAYKKAIELQPDYWGGYHYLGWFYIRNVRYVDAISQFEKVLDLTEDNLIGFNNLGTAYYYLGDLEKARVLFERSNKIEPNEFATNNLAVIYYFEERYKESARMMAKLMEWRDQKDYRLWANIAWIYYKVPGGSEKADEYLRKATDLAEEQLKIDPRDQVVISHLAVYYSHLGEHASALRMIKLIPEGVADVDVMVRVAEAYEKLKQRDEAIQWLKKALESGLPLHELEENTAFLELRKDERYRALVQSQNWQP